MTNDIIGSATGSITTMPEAGTVLTHRFGNGSGYGEVQVTREGKAGSGMCYVMPLGGGDERPALLGDLYELAGDAVVEFEIAEQVGCCHPRSCERCGRTGVACGAHAHPGCAEQAWRPLPHCGSWLTDRYYTNDLRGYAAAQAAATRVAEQAGGIYRVQAVRTFRRPFECGEQVVLAGRAGTIVGIDYGCDTTYLVDRPDVAYVYSDVLARQLRRA